METIFAKGGVGHQMYFVEGAAEKQKRPGKGCSGRRSADEMGFGKLSFGSCFVCFFGFGGAFKLWSYVFFSSGVVDSFCELWVMFW